MKRTRKSAKSHLRNSGRNDNLAEVARGIGYALLYIGDVIAKQDPRTSEEARPFPSEDLETKG